MAMATLVTSGTATTNPDPSTLSPVSPFNSSTQKYLPQQTWIDQAKPCLALRAPELKQDYQRPRIRVDFNPSGGAAVTYTVTAWRFNRVTSTWYKPQDNGSISCTGPVTTYIDSPDTDPWFLQLSNISAGTIQITYDNTLAVAF